MISLEISEGFHSQIDPQPIELAAKAALKHQSAPPAAELTIVITTDEQLRQLNLQYRCIDAPTDVLSFPAGFTDPESKNLYLGIICNEKTPDPQHALYGLCYICLRAGADAQITFRVHKETWTERLRGS